MRNSTTGIKMGDADIIAATPRYGRAKSKASWTPYVASTSMVSAGAPELTRYTVGKSPSPHGVEQGADQIDAREQREGDVDQPLVASGAIDAAAS